MSLIHTRRRKIANVRRTIENWQHEIRKLAPLIEQAMYQVHEKEAADVKKLQATLKLKAIDMGIKTNSGQETHAEASEDLHKARLKVGVYERNS